MTQLTNPRRWLAAAAAAAAIVLPQWVLADTGDGASCPGHADCATCPNAGSCQNAGGCAHMGGHHHGGAMGPHHWDPKTVTQVQGKVLEVEAAGQRGHGVHLLLAVGGEKLQVMVGPGSYLEQQGLTLAKGDTLEVKGSRLDRDGTPVLVAQEVTRGGKTVTLREADGTPRWAGQNAKQ